MREKYKEVETIKERTYTLKLSDQDAKAIFLKASREGMTVAELLENVIADLVDGTYSNGSDERMYMEMWFERCGFSMFRKDTFLQYLIEWDLVDSFLEEYDSFLSWQSDIDYFQKEADNAQTAEERETALHDQQIARENTAESENTLKEYYTEYAESTHNTQWGHEPHEPQSYEEGLAAVLAWASEYAKVR